MNLQDDDFSLMGLSPRFALDRATLDAHWRQLQAQVHPDRFAVEGPAAQRVAMQWAVRVNEAYQRLKCPVQRAAYLCALRGVAVDAERNTAMPPAFLMQQMAWREALDDAHGIKALETLDETVAAYERALMQDLGQALDDRNDTTIAASLVRALMFVTKFRADLGRRLDEMDD